MAEEKVNGAKEIHSFEWTPRFSNEEEADFRATHHLFEELPDRMGDLALLAAAEGVSLNQPIDVSLGYPRLVCILPQGRLHNNEVQLHGITEDPAQVLKWAEEHGLCDILACPEGSEYEARLERVKFV